MVLSTRLIVIHVWLPTELLAKLCQKSSECLDTMILSTASPETNIFMTSCAQAVLASEFLVIFCWGSTTLASAAEGIHLPKYRNKKPNKNHWIFVSCALIQILGGEGIPMISLQCLYLLHLRVIRKTYLVVIETQ